MSKSKYTRTKPLKRKSHRVRRQRKRIIKKTHIKKRAKKITQKAGTPPYFGAADTCQQAPKQLLDSMNDAYESFSKMWDATGNSTVSAHSPERENLRAKFGRQPAIADMSAEIKRLENEEKDFEDSLIATYAEEHAVEAMEKVVKNHGATLLSKVDPELNMHLNLKYDYISNALSHIKHKSHDAKAEVLKILSKFKEHRIFITKKLTMFTNAPDAIKHLFKAALHSLKLDDLSNLAHMLEKATEGLAATAMDLNPVSLCGLLMAPLLGTPLAPGFVILLFLCNHIQALLIEKGCEDIEKLIREKFAEHCARAQTKKECVLKKQLDDWYDKHEQIFIDHVNYLKGIFPRSAHISDRVLASREAAHKALAGRHK